MYHVIEMEFRHPEGIGLYPTLSEAVKAANEKLAAYIEQFADAQGMADAVRNGTLDEIETDGDVAAATVGSPHAYADLYGGQYDVFVVELPETEKGD